MSNLYLIYVRQSYKRKGENADADVSPEAQEKAARAVTLLCQCHQFVVHRLTS